MPRDKNSVGGSESQICQRPGCAAGLPGPQSWLGRQGLCDPGLFRFLSVSMAPRLFSQRQQMSGTRAHLSHASPSRRALEIGCGLLLSPESLQILLNNVFWADIISPLACLCTAKPS